MTEIVAALLGAGFLGIFYYAVRTRWPQSYFSISDFVARRVSASPLKYAAFRFGPIVAVCGFAAVTMNRLGRNDQAAVLLIAVMHGATTAARAVVRSLWESQVWSIVVGCWRVAI
jgi:hypothetical protein